MNEFDLIRKYFQHADRRDGLEVGIGDDCAVVTVGSDEQLAVSIDTMVQGRHFHPHTHPEDIGSRAVSVALSDLAAIGATPRWVTLALTIPTADQNWLASFSRGFFRVCREFDCVLIGGDTTKGPLTVSVQVHGVLPKGQCLSRDNAQVGDLVCVTGTLGDGAAALELINQGREISDVSSAYLRERFYRPIPQVILGAKLLGHANAAIDISDGFLADLGHICKASHVGARIDVESLPISDACREYSRSYNTSQVDSWALCGGDDYQLCFTLPKLKQEWINAINREGETQVTVVGEIITGSEVTCNKNGNVLAAENFSLQGYQHF